ncbi:hypothetical protein DsansV1_C09g0094971 [Dioscorea sansibarensis]
MPPAPFPIAASLFTMTPLSSPPSILLIRWCAPNAAARTAAEMPTCLLFVEQELKASKGRQLELQECILKEVNDSQEQYITQLI